MIADTQQGTPEPAVLGHQLDDFLSDLLNELDRLANTFKGLTPSNLTPKMVSASLSLKARTKRLRTYLNDSGPSRIKSDKVFVHSNKIVNKAENDF